MTVSADANIHYSIEDGVFIIHIDRPEKKNALLPSMYRALGDGINLADTSPDVNVILIRGTDDCFTSGNDVNSFVSSDTATEERPSVHFMHALHNARKPLIAAVNGLAIGIGTTLLLHCDLVYAADNSFLQLPFTRLGLCPEAGSSFLLPQQIGYRRAAELLLLGERFDAKRACEYGIVTAVLSQKDCLAHAMTQAKALAALPPLAVQTSKRLMRQNNRDVVPAVIEQELKDFGALLQSEDAQAIMQAFLDRKKAG